MVRRPWLLLALLLSIMCGETTAGILIDRFMWKNPPEYTIDKSFANQWWNVDLFCRTHSASQMYIGHVSGAQVMIESAITMAIDPCSNRLLYFAQERNAIRSYGSVGSGLGQFGTPMVVDVATPMDRNHTSPNYYNIFVVDHNNDRVQRLRYDRTAPDAGVSHVQNYTGSDIVRPIDLDIDNSGTFYPDNDDFVWVASENNKIVAINTTTGATAASYGSTGAGVGQFDGISAIACGRSWRRDFVNTDSIYVADAGNSRIVLLTWIGGVVQWVRAWSGLDFAANITDLEVDNFGQLWVTVESGIILKFADNLQPLGEFLPHVEVQGYDLNHPSSISNTGGYLGGGDMLLSERWSENSGLRAFAIATDISDLYTHVFSNSGSCSCYVYFTLADYSAFTSTIFNRQGNIMATCSNIGKGGAMSLTWDCKHNGQLVPADSYRVQVTATSLYTNKDTNQPVNSVTKERWFVTWQSPPCNWLVGDSNGDGSIDISDIVHLGQYIFGGGPPPTPHAVGSGDADCSRQVNISDQVYLVQYIFAGGNPPVCTCSDYAK